VLQHHARLDGYACQPLETEPALVWIGVLGVNVADNEDGFNPDAEIILFICYIVLEGSGHEVLAGI
jgi:hypothetical protein